jgi:hypothetical protein
MTQRTIQRFAAAAALAAVLFLAAAPAQARDLGPTHAWQRLQDLWARAVSVLWPWGGPPALEGRDSGGLLKAGPGTDPNGSPNPGSTAPAPGNTGG